MKINKKLTASIFTVILFFSGMFVFTTAGDEINEIFSKGIEYTNKGDYERAIREFSRVITEDSEYADAYLSLAIVYINKKMEFEAVRLLQKAIELDPNREQPYFILARVYERLEEDEKAIRTLEKFIDICSDERRIERAQRRLERLKGKD